MELLFNFQYLIGLHIAYHLFLIEKKSARFVECHIPHFGIYHWQKLVKSLTASRTLKRCSLAAINSAFFQKRFGSVPLSGKEVIEYSANLGSQRAGSYRVTNQPSTTVWKCTLERSLKENCKNRHNYALHVKYGQKGIRKQRDKS